MKKLALLPGALLVCGLLTSCGGSPKFVYTPPSSATPANSATLTGSVFSRNAFNDILTCVTQVDKIAIADWAHNMCKYLARNKVLVSPGSHKISISYAAETGQYTSGTGKEVAVDLVAGQTYMVKGELLDEKKVHVWLADATNQVVADAGTFDVETDWGKLDARIHPPQPVFDHSTAGGKDMNAVLPEMHHLLIAADFSDRAQPFQRAFVAKARDVAAACHIAVDFEMVEHATTLMLEPPQLPTPAQLAAKAASLHADGVLQTVVSNWNGKGGSPGRLDQPLTFGRYTLTTTLTQQPGGKILWSGTFQQDIDSAAGGTLADFMLQRFAKQGALPQCPAK